MRRLWIILFLVGCLALGWGLSRGEYSAVKGWATTLCTSCLGLTDGESHH